MSDYNDGKWHGWNGGDCPVHPQTIVEYVYLHDGVSTVDEDEAQWCNWTKGYHYPLVAFRVVKEYREPREWWSLWSPGGNLIGNFTESSAHERNTKHYDGKCDIIHVREVIE